MWTTILLANAVHGLVALVWAKGVRRLIAPRSADLAASLSVLGLVLPPMAAVLHGIDGLPWRESWRVVRLEAWVEVAGRVPPLSALAVIVFLGSVGLFLVQELIPALARERSWHRPAQPDNRLDASLNRVLLAYRTSNVVTLPKRPPRIGRLEALRPIAALAGILSPRIVVSRGLLERLADDELDAVVAHELAHLARGGNTRRLALWILRAVQAPSPAALVAFRSFVEFEEEACDATAASVLGTPAALSRALLEQERQRDPARPGARSLELLDRRASIARTRARIRRLLDGEREEPVSAAGLLSSATLLGGLLWLIR